MGSSALMRASTSLRDHDVLPGRASAAQSTARHRRRPPSESAAFLRRAEVAAIKLDAVGLDDEQRCVSAPAELLLAARACPSTEYVAELPSQSTELDLRVPGQTVAAADTFDPLHEQWIDDAIAIPAALDLGGGE
jgi:hypothetical protein